MSSPRKDIKELIQKHTPTKKAEKLRDLLYDVYNDDDFVFGVLFDLRTDELRQLMIEELEDGLTDSSLIILMAMDMKAGLYPPHDD